MENLSNNSFDSNVVVNQVSDIISLYAIPIISGIGLIANTSFLIILSNKSLKHRIYQDFWIKTFFDLIVCFIGIAHFNNNCLVCMNTGDTQYWILTYNFMIRALPQNSAFLASTYSEVYLILNRCINLFNPRNKTLHFKKLNFILILSFLSICLMIPFYYFIEIRKGEDGYELFERDFSNRNIFIIYMTVYIFIYYLLPITLLVVLNLISIIKFRKVVNSSTALNNNSNLNRKEKERRFARTVCFLSCLFILIKTLNLVTVISLRLSEIRLINLKFSELESSILNLSVKCSLLFNFSFHIFNCFFYIHMDSNLKGIILQNRHFTLNLN